MAPRTTHQALHHRVLDLPFCQRRDSPGANRVARAFDLSVGCVDVCAPLCAPVAARLAGITGKKPASPPFVSRQPRWEPIGPISLIGPHRAPRKTWWGLAIFYFFLGCSG